MKNNYFSVSVPFYIVRQNTEWDGMGVGVGRELLESTYSAIPKHRKASLMNPARKRQKTPCRAEQQPLQMSDALMFSLVGTATGPKIS